MIGRNIWYSGVAAVVVLAGCSSAQMGPAEVATRVADVDATERLSQARSVMASAEERSTRINEGMFVSAVARRSENGFPLPARFQRQDGFVMVRPEPVGLQDIASILTEMTGIPVSMAPDVQRAFTVMRSFGSGGEGGAGGTGGGMTLLPSASGGAQTITPGILSAAFASGAPNRMRINYRGPLSGFLDLVASHFGIYWEYDRREIKFSYLQTRTFVVHALPANIDLTSRLDVQNTTQGSGQGGGGTEGQGSGGGLGGGSTQSLSSEVQLRIWDEITKTVESIVNDQGKVEKSPSTGTITVTAPRLVMERVNRFMTAQNERLSRQVTVNVQLISIELNDGSDFRFDLQTIVNDFIRSGIALTVGTPGSIASAIAPGIGIAVTQGRAQGTEALLQALATRGRVNVRTATTVTTLNGVPAPVNIVNTRGYLAEVAVTQIPGIGGGIGGGVHSALRPGTVTTGFSLNILPRIDRDGQTLLMQFSINISELVGPRDGFNEFSGPGGSSIQLPNINSRNFVQQAEVESGQTIVVTGFERVGDTAERRGGVFSEFIGAGGSQVGNRGRTALVILITPRIVSSRPAITME